MLNLAAHIHELLLEHDCVSIPNFGGLVAQRFRAEINPGTNIMRPPTKRVSFHADLTSNAHLLTNKIAALQKVSADKANQLIAEVVDVWKADLNAKNSVKIDSVGRFYLDKQNAICFNQSLESNFDLDAFGLDMFRATAIKRDSEIKEAVTVAISESVKKTNNAFPFWRAAAVFIGVGALLTVGFFKADLSLKDGMLANFNPLHYAQKIELPPAEVTPVDATEETATETTPTATEETVHYNEVEVAPIKKEQPVAQSNSASMPYQIIVGSFKEESNAIDLLAQLRAEGHNSSIIKDGGNFSKVSIEGFSTRIEAVKAMRAYKLSAHKGAWIYSN